MTNDIDDSLDKGEKLLAEIGAHSPHEETCLALIKNGADVQMHDAHGRTALSIAARCGQDGLVKSLIEKGAAVAATDHLEWTPLMHAAYNGHVKIVQMLLEEGAYTTMRNKDGRTALGLAQMRRDALFLEPGFVDGYREIIRLIEQEKTRCAFRDAAKRGTQKKRRVIPPSSLRTP